MPSNEIKLAPRLDMTGAAVLQEQLIEALAADAVIDGRDVGVADTSCLQLLTAFVQSSASSGHCVTWREASPALVESARRLGLADSLQLGSKG
jgi:anti-anti-sigma regulatory factor